MALDAFLLEILNNKVAAAADEMFVTCQRTSRSTYVKEACDFGTAIIDRDGLVFGYPRLATIQFLIDSDCSHTIQAVPDLGPGDVIVTNHPYQSGGLCTHVPDIHMIKPYFDAGRIVAYGWCFIHFTDMGGRVPSSISPSNHEIFQEGLLIPPMKIVNRGEMNEDLVEILKANCRIPETNMGDVRAMLGCLEVGERRVADIIDRHGVETFLACQGELQDYTAAKARNVLRRLPDGEYEFWDYMDDDMVTTIPLRVRVRLTINDGLLHIDVSGSDPQVQAAYNVPTMGGRNYWITMRITSFMTTHDRTIAMNAGLYRHITVTNPPGTVMNAAFPDAVGIRHAPARRLNDALTGAILKAAPELMSAPTCGSSIPFVLAEYDQAGKDRTVSVLEPVRGGMGALACQDGVDGRDNTLNNMKNHPVETVESDCGVIIRDYDVRSDSGGPGEWRGGVGQLLTVEFTRDGGTVLARGMERLRFPPWGVAGGQPGQPLRAILDRGRSGERPLSKIDQLSVNKGDTVTILMPGASGYGDPHRRPLDGVLADVEQGFVSVEGAERDYGVVIVGGRVDEAATERLRRSRIKENIRADFDFGAEREAWEAVFDDATMDELNRRLYGLPKSVRQAKRRWIFDHAVPNLPPAGGRSLAEVLADPDAVRARLFRAMAEVFDRSPVPAASQGEANAAVSHSRRTPTPTLPV